MAKSANDFYETTSLATNVLHHVVSCRHTSSDPVPSRVDSSRPVPCPSRPVPSHVSVPSFPLVRAAERSRRYTYPETFLFTHGRSVGLQAAIKFSALEIRAA